MPLIKRLETLRLQNLDVNGSGLLLGDITHSPSTVLQKSEFYIPYLNYLFCPLILWKEK